MNTQSSQGAVLVTVVCLVAITAILACALLSETNAHMKLAQRQWSLEQAFYAAECGAEQAVSLISRKGVAATTSMTGSIGKASFLTFVIPNGGSHALNGSLQLNPNDQINPEFVLIKPDGSSILYSDLANDNKTYNSVPCVYYEGPAVLIHSKPQGPGSQSTLQMDGLSWPVQNDQTYDFVGEITVKLCNSSRDESTKQANGQWYLTDLEGKDIAISDGTSEESGLLEEYEIHSIGTINGVRRTVILNGVHQQSWAKFALWYHDGPGQIYFLGGEVFNGPVHANCLIYLQGNPIFNAIVTSSKNKWGEFSSAAVFNQGYELNAAVQSMASIKFTSMLANADLVLTGNASINLNGSNALICIPEKIMVTNITTNITQNWRGQKQTNISTNITTDWIDKEISYTIPTTSNALIYVKTNTSDGHVSVGGTLDGRLSVVSDYDIWVTNHIRYAVHPTNNSSDALGLIARRNVIVRTNAPNDLEIFAHIIAEGSATSGTTDGSFEVQDYTKNAPRGTLYVYGGIVQYYRGAVGQSQNGTPTHGFIKNYVFDSRFLYNPPPLYPVLTNEYAWKNWRDKSR